MTIRPAVPVVRSCVLAMLLATVGLAASCSTMLPRQYEYDEEVNLSLDGSATVYVNGSVPALVALHGIELDTAPTARIDRAALRRYFASDATTVTRLSLSRRNGRRFIHLRLAVSDVNRLSGKAPFSWATYAMHQRAGQYVYTQKVGNAAGRQVGDVGWRGNELMAFRLHLPARILYHDAPSKEVERGNILVWEQTLADRIKGVPIHIEARMENQSILYSAIALFGAMAAVVVVLFAGIIWWVVRKGGRETKDEGHRTQDKRQRTKDEG